MHILLELCEVCISRALKLGLVSGVRKRVRIHAASKNTHKNAQLETILTSSTTVPIGITQHLTRHGFGSSESEAQPEPPERGGVRGGAEGHPARLQPASARAGAPCVSAARPRTHPPACRSCI